MDLEQQIKEIMPSVIDWRRTMHQHPEVSFEEHWTSQYIEEELRKIGNIEISRPTPTSVLGIIKGKKPGKKIGLRADIDALPIHEERDDLEFKSKEDGVMHACGHDGHASILLGAAKVLADNTESLYGEIYLIFQHAEELPPGGAQEMVATGLFDDLDFIYGQHLFSTIPLGKIGIKKGPVTSNSDTFELVIKGKGGHAAMPENSIDPVIVGTQIVNQFQTIVSRITSPLDSVVISTTKFHAGSAKNIIPDTAVLEGSVRTIQEETRELVKEKMEKAVASICASYDCDYEFDFQYGYSAVVNNEEMTEKVIDMATKAFGDKVFEYPLGMGGEDFSAFSRVIPGTYAFIGAMNADKGFDYPHHHPKFGLDEDSFIDGVKMMVHVALEMAK
ncbi:M20 metallopeptidase family protein [Oceanobacillus salinisoli]|uniref:M20 metallopeptidase family protein n=1 Tax=Oceanobacillus salinisoli TaxID=2678611 RepID=UPI0012E243D5|nr:amidohydrolase [Oceanobacillus salinisoli]